MRHVLNAKLSPKTSPNSPAASLVWLSRSLRGSCREENTPAEQVEASATVHLPLDQLEPGDLALGLPAAPGRRERRPDRSAVLLQPRRKRLESTHPTRSGIGPPSVQRHTGCFRPLLPSGF